MSFEKWESIIQKARSLADLDQIIEEASFDESIEDSEYCTLYDLALERAREM